MDSVAVKTGWLVLAIVGAFCLGTIALHRGETINAIWLVAAATSIFLVAHRFYARFISDKALGLDPTRAT
ncbi:MAG: carbon starvation CstA family protein, partial [Dokdonella sp.]